MNKAEVAKVLWHLYNSVDQAGLDFMVKEAFASIPVHKQKKFIRQLLESYSGLRDPHCPADPEILMKAERLVKTYAGE